MKTKCVIGILPGEVRVRAVVIAIWALSTAGVVAAESAMWLLEKGIYTEETKGELKAASEIYRQIVDDPKAERSVVAQAQLRRGLCELKLGNKPQAISALERLTQEFPDKDKLLAMVEQHMPRLLDEMMQRIEQNYIREVDRNELLETALRAVVGKLDARDPLLRPNDTEFLGAHEVAQLNEQLGQKIAGIGAVLKVDEATREIVVATAMPDSPALKGGLRAGDRIIEVNGDKLSDGKKLEPVIKLLRGPVGTEVRVTVKRGSVDEVREIRMTRDVIRLPSVLGHHRNPDNAWEFMFDDQLKIGYLRLTQVGRESPQEIQSALESLKARGMKALILDLRNNPGGSLNESIAIADLFVSEGRILTVKGRSGETVYDAAPEGTFSGFPVALLVNRNTASAAEIIAACLQDHQRAVVVGERTFGQGIVRSLFPLSAGMGALKLPIAAYYRPSGKSVNRYANSKESDDWGVKPDAGYEVAFSEEELSAYVKYRTRRDRLHQADEQPAEFNDRQLQKALNYVQAQLGK